MSLFLSLSMIPRGKLRFRKAFRPCSGPRTPGPAAPALAREIRGRRAGGEGRSKGTGSAPGSRARVRPPAPRSKRSDLAAGKGGREGATDSRAWRSSPFFAADPGQRGRLGGGTAEGGWDSLPRASRGLALLRAGSCGRTEARRRARHRADSEGRTAKRGTGESEGRTEPPQRTDVPGGALAPEGVSRWQIEQLGNQRAERGRARRPGQSCGGRVSGRTLTPPGSAPAAAGRAEVSSPLRCPFLLPGAPFPGTWGAAGPCVGAWPS